MKKFEDLYKEIQENEEIKSAWEEANIEAKKINKITVTISVTISVIILLVAILLKEMNLIFFIIFANVLIFIISLPFRKKQAKYNGIFKQIVIKKLIENFYDNAEYSPTKGILKKTYNEPKYNEKYDVFYSDDYIKSKINDKYDMEMAEVRTIEQYTDDDGNTRSSVKFHGIFAKIVIDKSINNELRIEKNGSNIFSKNKLKMDSSEFEKYFDVSTTNKIIGMQLLTADVMEELVNFQKKTNMQYDIVIKNNNIYLRFHSGIMFEPQSLKKGSIDEKTIKKYFYMLNFTYNLSNKMIKLIGKTEV